MTKPRWRSRTLKVVLTSAYSEEVAKPMMRAPLVCGFIRKPFKIADLAQQLRSVLVLVAQTAVVHDSCRAGIFKRTSYQTASTGNAIHANTTVTYPQPFLVRQRRHKRHYNVVEWPAEST